MHRSILRYLLSVLSAFWQGIKDLAVFALTRRRRWWFCL